jgi:hypothetical protein
MVLLYSELMTINYDTNHKHTLVEKERIDRIVPIGLSFRLKEALENVKEVQYFLEAKATLDDIKVLDKLTQIKKTVQTFNELNMAFLEKTKQISK